MTDKEVQEICVELDALQFERQTAEKELTRQTNQLRSGVENILGYSTLLPEEKRKDIQEQATKVIEAAKEEGEIEGICNSAYEYAQHALHYIDSCSERVKRVKQLQEQAAIKLPVWEWCADVAGLGRSSVARLIGSIPPNDDYPGCGLGQFATKSKVHKFFRHHVNQKDGRDQRGMDASGEREKEVYLIGECLIKASGHYYDIYIDRKEYEIRRDQSDGKYVLGSPQTCRNYDDKGLPAISCKDDLPAELQSNTYQELREMDDITPAGHLNNRSARYMRKKFLRDIWQEWNAC